MIGETSTKGLAAMLLVLAIIAAPTESAEAQSRRGTPRLMQGPMIGAVTPTTVLIWTRASGSFRENIEGVILLSGDTHVGELNAIPWSEQGGYDFYDLVSSPLAQIPGTSWVRRSPEIRVRSVFAGSPNFGLIDFDLTEDDPSLSFNLVALDGRRVWKPFVLRASDLKNGVASVERMR